MQLLTRFGENFLFLLLLSCCSKFLFCLLWMILPRNYLQVTSIFWKDNELNMVDTPGHADFGGEVCH